MEGGPRRPGSAPRNNRILAYEAIQGQAHLPRPLRAPRVGLLAFPRAIGLHRLRISISRRLMGGVLHDPVYMACLASNFESPVLGRVFPPG